MAILTFTASSAILNWGSASSWIPSQVPTLGDFCVFTSSSATCSLNQFGTCSAIDFTNYNKQFRFNNNQLNIYGTVSFGVNMGYSFSTSTSGYNLWQRGTGSIITNNATISVPFIIYGDGASTTHTITGNLNMSENLSISAGGGALAQTINGSTVSCFKNLRFNDQGGSSAASGTTGSATFIMIGTGNLSYSGGNTNGLNNSLTINTSGTITLLSTIYIKGNLNWLSGLGAGAFSFLWLAPATFTNIPFNSGTYAVFGIGTNGSNGIVNLANDFYTQRSVNTSGGQLNTSNIYTYGGLSNVTNTLSGSSLITVTGTSSTSNATVASTANNNLNVVINTPGIVALSGIWGGSTFVYTAGNVNPTTFTVAGSNATITMPSNKFTTVSVGSLNQTISLLSNWNMTTLSIGNSNINFTGSNVWITDVFNNVSTSSVNVLTLKDGLTYSINKSFIITPQSYGSNFTIQSGASGSYTNLYTAPGATQTSNNILFKDVNNVGTPLWIYNPTLINTTNVWELDWRSVQQNTITTS